MRSPGVACRMVTSSVVVWIQRYPSLIRCECSFLDSADHWPCTGQATCTSSRAFWQDGTGGPSPYSCHNCRCTVSLC
uniref:Uncharacterized protein n=1 Tax=Arundo donax TaxID=35708 RepID=A0A0A9H338_ARUDO